MGSKRKDENLLGSCSVGGKSRKRSCNSVREEQRLFASDKKDLMDSDEELNSIEDDDIREYFASCIRHIWQAIEDNRILLGFSIIGYDYFTGYPIYGYDILTDLLISYGYTIDVVVMFLGEFSRSSWNDGTKRIVMNSSHKVEIFDQVEKLPDNPCQPGI